MAAETIALTFQLDGDETAYEYPEILSLDLDEWQVVYEYSGLILDDFSPALKDDDGHILDEEAEEKRQRRIGQAAFTKALLHIGYQRAHPELRAVQIKALVGKANPMRLLEHELEQLRSIALKAGGEEIPPALTSEPEPPSPESSLESDEKKNTNTESSSPISANGSGEQEDGLETITTGEQARSSALGPTISAA